MIIVKNRRDYKGPGVYVGRAMPGLRGSVLGNPYKVRPHGPYELSDSLRLYRRWLWNHVRGEEGEVYAELQRLKRLAEESDLILTCWCSPAPCHANVVRGAVEWMLMQNGEASRAK